MSDEKKVSVELCFFKYGDLESLFAQSESGGDLFSIILARAIDSIPGGEQAVMAFREEARTLYDVGISEIAHTVMVLFLSSINGALYECVVQIAKLVESYHKDRPEYLKARENIQALSKDEFEQFVQEKIKSQIAAAKSRATDILAAKAAGEVN